MSEEFKVEIVNPEKSFFSSENVTEVIVPAFEGEMGILKDHISIISFLKPGIIKIFSKNVEEKFYVDDGIVEFKDNNLSVPLKEARENFEKEYLTTQLKKFGGNISKTAKFVGMERSALHRKLKGLGVKDLN